MSFTCSVLYQNAVKKIQCPKNFTVNQLVQLSLEKFRLSDSFGELSYGGKKLDALLPIRLTNLVNNAKLKLTISNSEVNVSLKIVGSIDKKQVTSMIKLSSSTPIAELVTKFAALNDIEIDLGTKKVSLSVLQSSVDNLTTDFNTVALKSVLGNSSSAMIRLVVEDRAVHEEKRRLQEEQTQLRLKLEEEKRQARLAQREEMIDKPKENRIETPQESENKTPSPDPVPSQETAKEPLDTEMEDNIETEAPKVQASESQRENPEQFSLATENEDTVYVPGRRAEIYENPEDDYNMTTSQAEKYLNIIKSMQQRTKVTKKTARVPSHYTIRLRFPDRSLVQLHMEDSNVKLGQLVKKIDSFVDAKFINSYRIKNGSPPFKEIQFGFDTNNAPMNKHPEFQEEKLLLIWEPTIANALGPYLKDGVTTKDVNQLSTMMLEAHRGQLEDEVSATSKIPKEVALVGKTKSKLGSKIPKWFRP